MGPERLMPITVTVILSRIRGENPFSTRTPSVTRRRGVGITRLAVVPLLVISVSIDVPAVEGYLTATRLTTLPSISPPVWLAITV